LICISKMSISLVETLDRLNLDVLHNQRVKYSTK